MLLKITLTLVVLLAYVSSVKAQRRAIPVCNKPTDTEKLVGFEIKLVVPHEMTVNVSQDVDYQVYRIFFGSGDKPFQLSGFSGLNVGTGEVSRFYLNGSRKFSCRYWTHNKLRGVDARGVLKNGRLWRYFGMFGDTLSYYNTPADAATYFDRILDSACFLN